MKGLFIPGITVEMFRNGCLESIDALMADGEIYDIEYSKWIPVSERLPEEGGKYICWFKEQKRNIVTIVAWQPKLRSWYLTGNRAHWNVFAWMPLPQPYMAEGGLAHDL